MMDVGSRKLARMWLTLASLWAATLCLSAHGQAWPTKTITLVTPQATGGTSDILARAVAERLSQRLGQNVVVENRVGAGGNIGSGMVAKSAPDGYTLLVGYVGTLAINPALYSSVPFDPVDSFSNIVGLADVPLVLVVRSDFPAKTLDELVQYARTKPLVYGSAGNGTMNHMAGELLNQAGKIKMTHIPYRGVAPAVTDLVGGQIDLAFASMPSSHPFINSGKLRAIAVTSEARSKVMPEVPTMLESKLAPMSVSTWYSIMAPKGVPAAVVSRINTEVVAILETPEMKSRLEALGALVWPVGPDQLLATIKSDLVRWSRIVKESGAKVD